jgi:hypothetical protein
MPLFDWLGAFQMGWNLGQRLKDELDRFDRDVEGEHFGVTVTRAEIEMAGLEAKRWQSDREEGAKLARSRWLEANRAERSFPCGIVPDPVLAATDPGQARLVTPPRPLLPSDPGWASPQPSASAEPEPPAEPQPLTPLRPMNVIAAVLPDDIAFIREQDDDDEVDEVGRLPRDAIRDVDVVDLQGAHVPEPIHETFEPEAISLVVLRWTNAAADDEDRFAFRSPWMAWEAARRLLDARRG